MVQYKPQTDTHKKWIYIMNMIHKSNKQNKDKKVRGAEVLASTYFRAAYPMFGVMEEGKVLLQLHYKKEDKYLSQTVHKQDTIIKFLKKITKKDIILQGLLFEEGQEKDIYSEMETGEIDFYFYPKQLEEDKRNQQAIKEEERKLNEQEELFKKKQQGKNKQIVDPFDGGFLSPKNVRKPEPIIKNRPKYDDTYVDPVLTDKVLLDIPEDDLSF